jgi:D-alanine transaminase
MILGGVTRSVVLELADDLGIPVDERPFTLADVASAREAIVTSTSSWVMPVTAVGDHVVGDGKPGPVTRRLQAAYDRHLFGNRAAAGTVAEPRSAA